MYTNAQLLVKLLHQPVASSICTYNRLYQPVSPYTRTLTSAALTTAVNEINGCFLAAVLITTQTVERTRRPIDRPTDVHAVVEVGAVVRQV
jgi:hypothetical protein